MRYLLIDNLILAFFTQIKFVEPLRPKNLIVLIMILKMSKYISQALRLGIVPLDSLVQRDYTCPRTVQSGKCLKKPNKNTGRFLYIRSRTHQYIRYLMSSAPVNFQVLHCKSENVSLLIVHENVHVVMLLW